MAIFSAAAAAITAVGAWFSGLGIAAQIGIRFVGALAFNKLQRALAGSPESAGQAGFVGEIEQGADIDRSFLIGVRATAGSLAYHSEWGGSENEYYTRITALSDYPIEDLLHVFIDGVRYEIDRDNPHEDFGWPIIGISVENTRFRPVQIGVYESGRAEGTPRYGREEVTTTENFGWVRFYDGNQTEADSFVSTRVATEERPWSANEIGRGVAYAVSTFKVNNELFQGPPRMLFVCAGIRIFDPAVGAVTASENPIAQAAEILGGMSYNGEWFYGPQTGARINPAEVALEAQKCADPVPGAQSMSAAQRISAFGSNAIPQRYRCSLEVRVSTPIAETLEDIISACNGRISEVGTRYRLQVGDPGEPVLSITDADIRSTAGQSFAPFFPLAETVNAITATYPAPDQAWQAQDAPPLYRTDLEVRDGNRRLPAEVQLNSVPYSEQVQRLMISALAEAERARRHSATFPARFYLLEPGDVIVWSSERYGFTGKRWRVDGLADLPDGDITVDLTEVDPDDYNRDASAEFVPIVPGSLVSTTPPPVRLEGWAVRGLAVGSEPLRPGIELNWTPPADPQYNLIAYQIRLASDQVIVASGVVGGVDTGFAIITGEVLPATTYEVSAHLVTTRRYLTTAWLPATTPDVRLSLADLDSEVEERIEEVSANTAERAAAVGRPPIRSIEDQVASLQDTLLSLQLAQERLQGEVRGAGVYVDEDAGVVRLHAQEQLTERFTDLSLELNAVRQAISLTVSQSTLNSAIASAMLGEQDLASLVELEGQISALSLQLDGALEEISLSATQADLSAASARLQTAETTLSAVLASIENLVTSVEYNGLQATVAAISDTISAAELPTISRAVAQARETARDIEALSDLQLQELITSDRNRTAAGRDLASFQEQITAQVTGDRLSVVESINLLLAEVENARGNITQLANTRVTPEGAVAAVNQEVSATHDGLAAVAEAIQLATARLGEISSGFLFRARAGGAEGEVELVAASSVGGDTSQFRVSADRLSFDGDVTDFFGQVRITGDLIEGGTIERGVNKNLRLLGDNTQLNGYGVANANRHFFDVDLFADATGFSGGVVAQIDFLGRPRSAGVVRVRFVVSAQAGTGPFIEVGNELLHWPDGMQDLRIPISSQGFGLNQGELPAEQWTNVRVEYYLEQLNGRVTCDLVNLGEVQVKILQRVGNQ